MSPGTSALFVVSLLALRLSVVLTDRTPDRTPDPYPGAEMLVTDGQRFVKLGVNRPPPHGTSPAGRVAAENSISCLPYDAIQDQKTREDVHLRAVDRDKMDMLLEICANDRDVVDDTRRHKRFILPGTKWCGLGNAATDYEELGSEAETDRCCRTHDHCPDHISPFQTKNGITNLSILYRFNCACEERFYNCLKDVTNETAASLVGRFYFNLLEPTCFRIDHPLKCQQKGWWLTCKKKVLDRSQPKTWGFYKFDKSF